MKKMGAVAKKSTSAQPKTIGKMIKGAAKKGMMKKVATKMGF